MKDEANKTSATKKQEEPIECRGALYMVVHIEKAKFYNEPDGATVKIEDIQIDQNVPVTDTMQKPLGAVSDVKRDKDNNLILTLKFPEFAFPTTDRS